MPYSTTPENGDRAYTRSPQQVVELWQQRRKDRSPLITQMSAIRAQYNGDVVVPLPELNKDEKSFVPNLIQQGMDQHAMRIASVMPSITCPPVNDRLKGSVDKADLRRRATYAWWEASKQRRILRRRARHLIGYSQSPVMIRPNFRDGIPAWHWRNPLDAFPAPCVNPDDLCPDDIVFAVLKPYKWLQRAYPEAAAHLFPKGCREPELALTVLEYEDAEQMMQVVVGQALHGIQSGGMFAVLEQAPNRAEVCGAVVPGRIGLDRLVGQFDGILGMHQMQAKLMALEVNAVVEGVYPTQFLVERPNETASIDGGVVKPGHTGEVNIVRGGDFREQTINPAFATLQAIDRLEMGQRVQAGIPADLTGQASTNVRTGRRGDQILSATIDFSLQEAQETFAASLEEENYRATKIAKAYFGNRPKSFHVRTKGAKGAVTYTPNKDFDSDYTQVDYPGVGTDANDFIIGVGQRVGLGTMSTETARRLDPLIDDADLEGDLVTAEGFRRALIESVQQQAMQGAVPAPDVARMIQLIKVDNMDPEDAVIKAHEEAQARQAAVTAQGQPDAALPGSPAAQPGLAAPGAGAEAGVAIPEAPTALGNLDQFLMQMRGTGANP